MCEIKDEFIYSNTVRRIPTEKENQQTIIGTLDFYYFVSQNVSLAVKITRNYFYSLMRKKGLTPNTSFSLFKSFCFNLKIVLFLQKIMITVRTSKLKVNTFIVQPYSNCNVLYTKYGYSRTESPPLYRCTCARKRGVD